MTTATALSPRSLIVYRLFKYTIYALLSYNIYLFFIDEYTASNQMFSDGVGWRNLIEAYSATIDTASWVVLLLLFELETAVIPDKRMTRRLTFALHGIRLLCYLVIVYAFYGYCVRYGLLLDTVNVAAGDPCTWMQQTFYTIVTLDDYPPLTAENCQWLQNQQLQRIAGTSIIGTQAMLEDIQRLALLDVINAGDWLLVVAILEIEVILQLRDQLTPRVMLFNKLIKFFLYGVLFAAAAYWGLKGDFLDFWDAFLWLVAFIFIELNIFEWNAETRLQKQRGGLAQST